MRNLIKRVIKSSFFLYGYILWLLFSNAWIVYLFLKGIKME